MNVELTDVQFQNLIKLVYLGNLMINGVREVTLEEFQDLESHLLKVAAKNGLSELVSSEEDVYYPSPLFDETMSPYVEMYDEAILMEQINLFSDDDCDCDEVCDSCDESEEMEEEIYAD